MTRPRKKGGAKRAPKSRSGTTLTQDARRESGARVICSFTLPQPVSLLIGVLADKLGVSRSEVVSRGATEMFQRLAGTGAPPLDEGTVAKIARAAAK